MNGNDILVATTNDRSAGSVPRDTLIGGLGNDTFIIPADTNPASAPLIQEDAAQGDEDTIVTGLAATTLNTTPHVEHLTLIDQGINATGNALSNRLRGNASANQLVGGNGDDTLDGGEGFDSLVGGAGNDVFIVDSRRDVIVEFGNQGTDTVHTSVSLTLAPNVEHLVIAPGSDPIPGSGNAENNELVGNSGHNVLEGGPGADVLTGTAIAADRRGDSDSFRLTQFTDSILAGFDRITDLVIGLDIIDAPTPVPATSVIQLRSPLADFSATGLITALNGKFAANGATIFSFDDRGISRTFIALNNSTAAFEPSLDAILEITDFQGDLNALSIS